MELLYSIAACNYISQLALFFAAVRFRTKELLPLILLAWLAIGIETAGAAMALNGTSNLFLFHYYTPIETSLLIWLLLKWEKGIRSGEVKVLMILFVLVISYSVNIIFSGIDQRDNIISTFQMLILLPLSLRLLYINWDVKHKKLILTGIVIYMAYVGIFYNLMGDFFLVPFIAFSIINITANIFYSIGITQCHRHQ